MPFIPTPDTNEVTLLFQSDQNTFAENVFHVTNTSPDDSIEQLGIANLVVSWAFNTLAPHISNEVAVVSCMVKDVSVEDGTFQFSDDAALPFHMTHTGGTSPFQVAAVISLRTAQSGRSFRGRIYVPFIPNAYSENNILSATGQAAYLADYETLRTDLNTNGTPLVVVSKQHNLEPRTEGVKTYVTSIQVPQKLGTQRRRLT